MPPFRWLVAFLFAAVLSARAQVVLHHYRGGEDDAGAAAGLQFLEVLGYTIDVGTNPIDLNSTFAAYTSTVAAPGSSLAYDFSGTGGAASTFGDTSLTPTSSFAFEAWVKPGAAATGLLFANGKLENNGIGLALVNGNLTVAQGGQGWIVSSTAVSTATWSHVAFAYDNGAVGLYLNGSLVHSATSSFIALPDSFSTWVQLGSENIGGLIDDARIFTFTSGSFDTSMLSYSAVPEPSTYAAIFGAAVLGLAGWRKRRRAGASASAGALTDVPVCRAR